MKSEIALIGALLTDPSKMIDVIRIVNPQDFLNSQAREAFTVATALWKNKRTVDLVSVSSENMSLATFLAQATSEGAPIGVLDYARQIAEKATLRRIEHGLSSISEEHKPNKKLQMMIDLYQQENKIQVQDPSIKAVLKRYDEYLKKGVSLFSTGFSFLDKNYIKMCGGDIWMLGAFTSVGKTAMSLQIVCNMLRESNCPNIVILSTEMTEVQITSRIIGNFTGIFPPKIQHNNLTQHEQEEKIKCQKWLESKPLKIYTNLFELSDIEAVLLENDLRGGVDVVVLDYVQNCTVDGITDAYLTQKTLANRFQPLVKDIDCCMLCLSQVSNSAAKDGNVLEYKGAGEWAAATDVGLMIYKNPNADDEVVLAVKKNRHGKKDMEHKFQYVNNFTSLVHIGEATRK